MWEMSADLLTYGKGLCDVMWEVVSYPVGLVGVLDLVTVHTELEHLTCTTTRAHQRVLVSADAVNSLFWVNAYAQSTLPCGQPFSTPDT
jgi:hypothetical protein